MKDNVLYDRNYIYISSYEQELLSNYEIFLAGCGIGSNIAECALRLGFEKQTLIDGDTVGLSNLDRQNYSLNELQGFKSESLETRLLSIN